MSSGWMEFKNFTDEQVEALTKILSNPDKDYLIRGCAGSGKTILGIALYKDIQDDNKSAGFMVFTKLLSKFTHDNCVGFARPNHIIHYHMWRRTHVVFDTVIIDESQDFEEAWVEDVEDGSTRRIWLGDERQQIYDRDTEVVMSRIRLELPEERQIVLNKNLRNPFYVALLASCFLPLQDRKFFIDNVLKGEEELAGSSNKGGMVHFVKANSVEEEYSALAEKINFIHNDSYGKTRIAIVQRHNADVTKLEAKLVQRGIDCIRVNTRENNTQYPDFNSEKLTMLCTMHSLKGLELDYIMFPRADDPENYHDSDGLENIKDNLLHVLFTRATTSVYCSYVNQGRTNYLYQKVMVKDLDLGDGETIPTSYFIKELKASEILGHIELEQSEESPSAQTDKDIVKEKIERLIAAIRERG